MKKNYIMRMTSIITCLLMIITLFPIPSIKVNAVDYETVIWPVQGNWHTVSSGYGPRGSSYHYAIDIPCTIGTNILAVASGKVVSVKTDNWNEEMGKRVVLDHGNSIYTAYQHLSDILVSVGDIVEQGQVIALSGNTGLSSGPHLDFHVKINSGTNIAYPSYFNKNPLDNFLPYEGYVNGTYIKSGAYSFIPEYTVKPQPSDIQFSGGTYPEGYNHTIGKPYTLGGVINSNNRIEKITGGVYTRVGIGSLDTPVKDKNVFIENYNPGSKTVNLLDYIDKHVIFDNLTTGYYRLKFAVTDSTGYTKTVVNWNFTVGIGQSPTPTPNSSMQMTQNSIPKGNIAYNTPYYLKDKITSSLPITHVWGGVYSTDWSPVQKADAYPNAYEYSLSTYFDYQIIFNKLQPGSYYYLIEAVDTSGKQYTLANSSFTIVGSTPVNSYMTISGQTIPTSLIRDSSFGIYGNITSNLPITKVWGGIYYDDWTVTSLYTEAFPNSKTYSLYPYFDNVLIFNKLSAGSYHYLIKATDSSGKEYVLINSGFTVNEKKQLEFYSSTDSLTLNGFETKDIVFTCRNNSSKVNIKYNHGSKNATSLSWNGNWAGDDIKLSVKGLANGTETITVDLINDDTQAVIASKKINVTVTGISTSMSVSKSNINLNLTKGETQNITLSYDSVPISTLTLNMRKIHSDNSIAKTEFLGWDGKNVNYNISGLKVGSEDITFELFDKDTGVVLARQVVHVNNTVTCNVKLDLNSENARWFNEPQLSYSVNYGETYSFIKSINETPIRIGASFAGWYTDKTGGVRITSDSIVNIDSDHTLYAHWNNLKCKVEFMIGDEIFNSRMFRFDEAYGELPVPILKEYEFLGWYTEENGGEEITKDSRVSTSLDHVLYAHLRKKTSEAEAPFELSTEEVFLYAGNSYFLNIRQSNLTYKSNNEMVATVSEDGAILAHSEGTAIITIINSEYDTLQLKVNVKNVVQSNTTIDINADGVTDSNDITALLDYFINKSDNDSSLILKDVNNDGIVNILDVIITKNSVIEPPVIPEIIVSSDRLEIFKGEKAEIESRLLIGEEEVNIIPEWISADQSVVYVEDGTVEALGEGRTMLTVVYLYDDQEYKKDIFIEVKPEPYIKLLYSSVIVENGVGYQIKYDVYPKDAEISWTVSKPEEATITEDGIIYSNVETSKMMTVKAIITVNGNEYKDGCTVYAVNGNYTLEPNISIKVGDTYNLKIGGWSGTSFESQPEWTSSDENIAIVDDFGNVYAVSEGNAIITADIFHDGLNYIFECKVDVNS